MSAPSLNTLVGGIVGTQLAPSLKLATLPVTLSILGVAAATIPVARVLSRAGRRTGFMLGALLGAAAAILAAFAIQYEWFWIYCLATFLLGVNLAFVQQFRFAAAESVEPAYVSRAVSFVLLGTLIAAFLGPELVRRAVPLAGFDQYPVAYLMLAVLLGIAMLVLWRLPEPVGHTAAVASGAGRPLREIVRQPGYRLAVLAAAGGYGVMSFLMTATPISMHVHDGHSLDSTAFVIQSHVIAMFLPSLFTGELIRRFGERRLFIAGVLAFIASLGAGSSGHALVEYWLALVLLGIGWNFLFVGGTTLLTRQYRPAERFRAQATNDFLVFSTTALASLLSGTAIYGLGWDILMWIAALPLVIVALAVVAAPRKAFAVQLPDGPV